MWQYVLVGAAVALAAWFVWRRFRRGLDPAAGGRSCCGCSLEGDCPAPAGPAPPGEGDGACCPGGGPGDHEKA